MKWLFFAGALLLVLVILVPAPLSLRTFGPVSLLVVGLFHTSFLSY